MKKPLLFLFLFLPLSVHAQSVELPCPSGTFPVPGFTTTNSVTGKLRQNLCMDLSGNLYFTVTGIQSVANANGVLIVDGVKYVSVDAALQAAGANPSVLIVPPSYTGANPVTSVPLNVTLIDLRGTTNFIGGNSITMGNTDASGVQARFRVLQNPVNPLNNTSYSTGNFLEAVQGQLQSTNAAYDGLACESDTAGTITSSATGRLSGCEATVAVNSQGGNLFDARAININGRMTASDTTTLSNYEGVYSQTFVNSSGVAVTNVYGLLLEDQNAGTSNNLSMWAKGALQVDKKALFDCSVSGMRCVVIQGDSLANNNELEIIDTHAGGHTWDLGEMQQTGVFSFRDLTVASGPSFDHNLSAVTNGARSIHSYNASANRTYTYPDGNAALAMPATLTTTAAASDNVTVTGMTASGHCTLAATNASAATNIATTFISAKSANQITVSHTATSGMTYDFLCTPN